MFKVFLPVVSAQGIPHPVRFGWALYGGALTHDQFHECMDVDPSHCWIVYDHCLERAYFQPYVSGTSWAQMSVEDIARFAAARPGLTWLLWNEPDMVTQASISPADALPITRTWIDAIGANGRIGGYGVSIHEPGYYSGGLRWLEEFLQLGGPMPDCWHIHIYADDPVKWQHYFDEWQTWNQSHGALPTIVSEAGGNLNHSQTSHGWFAIYHYLRQWVEPRVEAVHWYTDNPALFRGEAQLSSGVAKVD